MLAVLSRVRALDPRWYQITSLSCFLVYGFFGLGFEVTVVQAIVTLVTVLAVQFACTRLWRLPAFDPKSALISGLGLCILLRANDLGLIALAATMTIASKFIVRANGKHVFNPTNFTLVALLAIGAPMWVSPGQWGSVAVWAFFMASLGGLVVLRAARADVSIAFIAFWCIGLFGRSLWLGEPMTIPLHRLESGALMLFTFFMISDPKTTPNSRAGRILFAFLVALGAWWIQFGLFRTNGILWALAACSLLVPLIDRFVKGARFDWRNPTTGAPRGPELSPAE